MVFSEKQTARQAFQTLDVDVDIDEFGSRGDMRGLGEGLRKRVIPVDV